MRRFARLTSMTGLVLLFVLLSGGTARAAQPSSPTLATLQTAALTPDQIETYDRLRRN